MKGIVSKVIVLFVAAFCLAGCAQAEDRVDLLAGLRVWHYGTEESTEYWSYGPVLSAGGDNWYLSLSYLFGKQDSYDLTSLDLVLGHDFNPLAGYLLSPQVGIFLGYRNDEYRSDRSKLEWDGFACGIRGLLPLGESGFTMYGSFAYLPDVMVEMMSGTVEVTGKIADFGIGFSLTSVPVTVFLGYRLEQISVLELDSAGFVLTTCYKF